MSDRGPEAPEDYAESAKSTAASALDQAQGAYHQASGQVRNATDQGCRSDPRPAPDRGRRGLRDRDHGGATHGSGVKPRREEVDQCRPRPAWTVQRRREAAGAGPSKWPASRPRSHLELVRRGSLSPMNAQQPSPVPPSPIPPGPIPEPASRPPPAPPVGTRRPLIGQALMPWTELS